MATIRRRIQRPPRPAAAADARRQARVQQKHDQLQQEQAALGRWMTRLKRAFHAVEKQQRRIARLEKQLDQLQRS